MRRPIARFRVLGPPAPRRPAPLLEREPASEHEVWYIDSLHCSVAALWLDGMLWLAGEQLFVDGEPLALGDAAPYGFTLAGSRRWAKLAPEAARRYVAITGAARAPDASIVSRDATLDASLDVAAAPEPSRLAKLFGKRATPVEAVALVLDVVDEPEPDDLDGWLEALRGRGIDISWAGNESGFGFVQRFRKPLREGQSVQAALLDHARDDGELTKLVREYTQPWLESNGESSPEAGRLVAADPTRGWIGELELADVIENLEGRTSTWLDPGTGHARRGHQHAVPAQAIVAALRRHTERPAIVAVHSAPEESVLAVHLLGGIDRVSGELVGFAIQRVWT